MKRALVTGANRGIGLEVVRQLLVREYEVFFACRDPKKGEQAIDSLGGPNGRLYLFELDVSEEELVNKAASRFSENYDRLDILINNAGVLLDRSESILSVSEADLNETWNVNSMGALRVTRAFLPFLRKSEDARVINVSSLAGQLSSMNTWAPAYRISKTALNAVTCILAKQLSEESISVTAVSPGWIKTEMGGSDAPGTLKEGADTIVWLADKASAELTGGFYRDRQIVAW